MAFRLCFAFCLLAAGAASMGRSIREARLRSRLEGDSWVGRANAAILLSDEPRAVPWLARLVNDEATPVRQNVRWALHRLTGLPWGSRPDDCAAWIEGRGAKPDPQAARRDETIEIRLEWESPDLIASINPDSTWREDHPDNPRRKMFGASDRESYSAILFATNGSVLTVLGPPQPSPGVLETRLFAEDGRPLAVWYWSLGTMNLGEVSREIYSLADLPPGRYWADGRVGPTRSVVLDDFTRPPGEPDPKPGGDLPDSVLPVAFTR